MIIEIPGKPLALQRARVSKKGFFDPNYQAKKNIAWYVKKKYPDIVMVDKPISLTATFFMPMPKSISKKKKISLNQTPHFVKPDLDNLVKAFDTFNGVLWRDDALIWEIHATKLWAEEGLTVLEYEVLED